MLDKKITKEEFETITSRDELLEIIQKKGKNIDKVLYKLTYEEELKKLQIELVKLQQWVANEKKRVVIIFEGRDAA
ncbi:MAG TPA: polyphosphate kinase 2, partial [Flavobacteriaceae bacterium]|nr:polyphosphate kinase 2 [Flavobacteriaceae bacterium]HBS11163.1 polyphosphate kinase 2 [Flavobacteriaceae bacterium]